MMHACCLHDARAEHATRIMMHVQSMLLASSCTCRVRAWTASVLMNGVSSCVMHVYTYTVIHIQSEGFDSGRCTAFVNDVTEDPLTQHVCVHGDDPTCMCPRISQHHLRSSCPRRVCMCVCVCVSCTHACMQSHLHAFVYAMSSPVLLPTIYVCLLYVCAHLYTRCMCMHIHACMLKHC
jgi:hypothetical protein